MSFNTQIDDLLDSLSAENSDQVERELRVYDVNDIVAVVVERLLDVEAGGGGGGTPTLPLIPIGGANTDVDLLLINEPAGYANNSNTGNVLRLSDGTTDVLLMDAYGDLKVTSPVGQGNPQLSLRSADNGDFAVTLGNNGLVITDASNTEIAELTTSASRLSGTQLQVLSSQAGFFGAAPVVQPVVPLTIPSVQDVIGALVALGLVSQSD